MNLLKFVLVVSAVLLTFGIVAEKIAYGIYEDQGFLCLQDYEATDQLNAYECKLYDINDLTDDLNSDQVYNDFNNDIDTFDIGDID